MILAGTQDISADTILINALSQASLQYGGVPVEDAQSAEELLNSYLMAFGLQIEPVPYEELDLTAFRAIAADGVPQFFPPGTVLVAVEYEAGIALYQVVFDGPIADYEPLAREIIANATIGG